MSDAGRVKKPFFQYIDEVGDGSGNEQMTGDYSSTAKIFLYQPSEKDIARLHRLLVFINDTNGFQAQEYGNLGAALTNGITVQCIGDGGVCTDITNGLPIKTNAEWARLSYDADVKSWGAGDEVLVVRFTFSKAGMPIRLEGSKNERFEIVLNDDFTGLIQQTMMLQGFLETQEE